MIKAGISLSGFYNLLSLEQRGIWDNMFDVSKTREFLSLFSNMETNIISAIKNLSRNSERRLFQAPEDRFQTVFHLYKEMRGSVWKKSSASKKLFKFFDTMDYTVLASLSINDLQKLNSELKNCNNTLDDVALEESEGLVVSDEELSEEAYEIGLKDHNLNKRLKTLLVLSLSFMALFIAGLSLIATGGAVVFATPLVATAVLSLVGLFGIASASFGLVGATVAHQKHQNSSGIFFLESVRGSSSDLRSSSLRVIDNLSKLDGASVRFNSNSVYQMEEMGYTKEERKIKRKIEKVKANSIERDRPLVSIALANTPFTITPPEREPDDLLSTVRVLHSTMERGTEEDSEVRDERESGLIAGEPRENGEEADSLHDVQELRLTEVEWRKKIREDRINVKKATRPPTYVPHRNKNVISFPRAGNARTKLVSNGSKARTMTMDAFLTEQERRTKLDWKKVVKVAYRRPQKIMDIEKMPTIKAKVIWREIEPSSSSGNSWSSSSSGNSWSRSSLSGFQSSLSLDGSQSDFNIAASMSDISLSVKKG